MRDPDARQVTTQVEYKAGTNGRFAKLSNPTAKVNSTTTCTSIQFYQTMIPTVREEVIARLLFDVVNFQRSEKNPSETLSRCMDIKRLKKFLATCVMLAVGWL